MSIRFLSQWLWLFLMLGLLTACGGGAFEEDTGDTSGSTADTSDDSVDNDFTGVDFLFSNLSLIESGGNTTVSFTTFITDADRAGEIAPNVDLNITVHPEGTAKLENVPTSTDQNGDAAFTVSHPGSGNVIINISGAGSFKQGFNIPLYFGASVTAEVVTKGIVPADGKTPNQIIVIARDWAGVGIPGMAVDFAFPLDSFAVPTASGDTDENGEFTTGITNTVPQTTKVTPFVGGMAAGPLTLTFGTSLVATKLERLDLIVKNKTVPPNGTTTAKVVIVARGASEAPVPNIAVNISSDSATAQLNIVGTAGSKTLFINGDTGTEGRFELEITNTVEETVELTATTIGTDETIGPFKTTIEFASEQSDVKVGSIKLDPPINNDQPANGTEKVTLQGWVSDANGKPIVGQDVSIIVSGGSALIAEENPTTNASGRFSTTITDTIVEEFKATAVVGNVSSNEVTLKFVSAPGAPGAAQSVTLLASSTQQVANGIDQITLTAVVRDSSNTPLKGVDVSIASPSNTAIFDKTAVPTGEGGTAVFNISNTVAETLAVTATAQDQTGVQNLTFTKLDSNTFDMTATPAEQPADGESVITLAVTFKKFSGEPISGAGIEFIMNSSNAKIDSPTGTTNALGEFSTTVKSTVPETDIKITPVLNVKNIVVQGAVAKDIIGEAKLITFVPVGTGVTLTANVVNDNQPANGTDAIQIDVVATKGGQAVPNVPIVVTTDDGEAVVDLSDNQTNEQGLPVTDEKGYFKIKVTSSKRKSYFVNILAKDTSVAAPPQQINFIQKINPTPTTVELIVKNAPQPADGVSEITLVVIAKDATDATIPEVDVQLIPESEQITITQTTGKTDALGEFRTTVITAEDMTNTLVSPLIVNVTPVAGALIGNPTPVIFTPVAVPIPATLSLSVTNNNAEVGEEATITVVAWDDNGSPMEAVTVRLSIAPGDEAPNVTGSAIFGSDGFEGETAENTGVFKTTLKNTQAGTVKVTAAALGIDGAPILNSNSVDVTFRGDEGGGDVKEIENLRLIADSSTLDSEGKEEGVTITAIVKDKKNNLVEGAQISFQSDSGELQIASGTTDVSGRAQALLTTKGDADNRTITVTATVPTTLGKDKEASISIDVVGTEITISGPKSVIQNAEETFTISMRNSKGKGIAGQQLSVKSELGNLLNNDSSEIEVDTNINGQVVVTLLASNAGDEIIRASKLGVPDIRESTYVVTISDETLTVTPIPLPAPDEERCTSIGESEDINNNRVLDVGEDLDGDGVLDLGCEIPLNKEQTFEVEWLQVGSVVSDDIMVSTSRGTIKSNISGDPRFPEQLAKFIIEADNAGTAIVIVRGDRGGSPAPSLQFNVKFVATEANSMTVQATPAVIGVNPIGTDAEQSEILAVVRDPENNLVFGKRVNFTLEDVTGGRLTEGTVFTDDFGRANTVYIAGPTSSAANGVTVKATVADTPAVSSSVDLTVAQRDLFVKLGSGNELVPDAGIRYKVFHTVLVTDSNGTPVNDAEVILSVYPLTYRKAKINPETGLFVVTAECPNEDINRNGLLDGDEKDCPPGSPVAKTKTEDINCNGRLEPGNVITVDNLTLITGQVNPPNTSTPPSGFADFDVIYAIQYAAWIKDVELTAHAKVAGSEESDTLIFQPVCSAPDAEAGNCPILNPFGGNPCDQPD